MIRLLIVLLSVAILLLIYRCKTSDNVLTDIDYVDTTVDTTTVSTGVGEYFVLEKEFDITELGRKRKIWMYLPPNYENSGQYYPVIYMHDGQNLFDRSASFAGEWEIDESLDIFHKNNLPTAIVVGIENSRDEARLDEYSPWRNTFYNKGGEGEAYVNFIVNDLKPYIDANYRTRSEQSHTGIGGSSMGGLISMYAIIEHQNIFGKALIFSPSFWFSEEAYEHVQNKGREAPVKIYLAAGRNEDGNIAANTERMRVTLQSSGFRPEEINIRIDGDGFHGEGYWARAFQPAYRWLFVD